MSCLDPRIGWPYSFGIRRYCKCTKAWDGPGCTDCAEGYRKNEKGNCVARSGTHAIVRRNALGMTDAEWITFWNVINQAKMTPSNYLVYKGTATTTEDTNPRLTGTVSFVKPVTVYNLIVWMHYYATKGNKSNKLVQCDFAHEQSGFLTWHRAWLLFVERELRKLSAAPDNFAIPYWDWTDTSTVNQLFNNGAQSRMGRSFIANNGDKSAKTPDPSFNAIVNFKSSQWQTVCTDNKDAGPRIASECDPSKPEVGSYITRCLGCRKDLLDSRALPTAAEQNRTIDCVKWLDSDPWDKTSKGTDSFRNSLEGWVNTTTLDKPGNAKYHEFHNRVHIYMGGTMADVSPAPNDPIFLLHHANVDRIFEIWLKKTKKTKFIPDSSKKVHPGHAKNDWIVPIIPFVTHEDIFKTASALGYAYDNTTVPSAAIHRKLSLDRFALHLLQSWHFLAVTFPSLTQTFIVAVVAVIVQSFA